MPGYTGSGTADCTLLLSSTTRSVTFTPAESCTPHRPVRWHDSRIQDEGTGDGLFITVLMLRTFKTIQVTQESAVLPNLQRARAAAPHGSYRFDPCARGKGLFACVSAVCNKTVATGTWIRYSVPRLRVADVHHRFQLSFNSQGRQ